MKKLTKYLALSLLIGLAFRAPSTMQDALSERAWGVGFWSWHILGWLVRDLVQAVFVGWCGWRACRDEEWKRALLVLMLFLSINALASYFAHNALYEWTVLNRWRFNW